MAHPPEVRPDHLFKIYQIKDRVGGISPTQDVVEVTEALEVVKAFGWSLELRVAFRAIVW